MTSKGTEFSLIRELDDWRLEADGEESLFARKDYIISLLLGVADMSIIEEKTNDAKHHEHFGVELPKAENKDSIRVRAYLTGQDKEQTPEIDLIIGDLRKGKGTAIVQGEHYVRRTDSDQVYVVKADVNIVTEARHWQDRILLRIPATRVSSVALTSPKGDTQNVAFSRPDPRAPFGIPNLKDGQEIKDQGELVAIASAIQSIDWVTSQPINAVSFPDSATHQAVYETFKGLRILIAITKKEDRYFAKMTAEEVNPTTSGDGIFEEAQNMANRFSGRVFEIHSIPGALLTKTFNDLVTKP